MFIFFYQHLDLHLHFSFICILIINGFGNAPIYHLCWMLFCGAIICTLQQLIIVPLLDIIIGLLEKNMKNG